MAANSDGCSTTTIVTCEGDLSDPNFSHHLKNILNKLTKLLGDELKVHKLEPWNSVRVTLSVPREAALRLRQLASDGSQQLRALGILSVQVEGDQVISLRLASASSSEPQEIILETIQQDDNRSNPQSSTSSAEIQPAEPVFKEKVQFRSPNVVCPTDTTVPKVPLASLPSNGLSTNSKSFSGPFPFTSMNQAIHSNRGETSGTSFNAPPPPYPGKQQQPVTISSPLLVNLLQNDGSPSAKNVSEPSSCSGSSSNVVQTNSAITNKVVGKYSANTLVQTSSATGQVLVKKVIPQQSTSKPSIPTQALLQNTSSVPNTVAQGVNLNTNLMNVLPRTNTSHISAVLNTNILQTKQMATSHIQNNLLLTHNNIIPQKTASQDVGIKPTVINSLKSNLANSNAINSNMVNPNVMTTSVMNSNVANPNVGNPSLVNSNPANPNVVNPTMGNPNAVNSNLANPNAVNSNLANPHLMAPNLGNSHMGNPNVGNSNVAHPNVVNPNVTNPNLSSSSFVNPNLANSNLVTPNLVTANLATPNVVNPSTINHVVAPPEMMLPSVKTEDIQLHNSLPSASRVEAIPTVMPFCDVKPTIPSTVPSVASVPYRPNPPVYSSPWDAVSQSIPPLQDLTPSLTELKADDLDSILPSLERELANSPPELSEEFIQKEDKVNFLINPLTGELEPQSSSDSEVEEIKDVFTGLPSPAAMTDEDTNSTIRPDTTDQSDSETRSSHSDSGKHFRLKSTKTRDKGRDSPNLKPTEKIKLRLKLEKSEPINPAYKVDVSFINTQQPKKLSSVPGEELRVPPLHISLRGRNHAVINNKKKIKTEIKSRKLLDHSRNKKSDVPKESLPNNDQSIGGSTNDSLSRLFLDHAKNSTVDSKKLKKTKLHDYRDQKLLDLDNSEVPKHSMDIYSTHYKEKHKERRGSDSELVRSSRQPYESVALDSSDKKRRLSQTEDTNFDLQPLVLGSTNTGTISSLPNHKVRKEKLKLKETFKSKDLIRNKNHAKILDSVTKPVVLPTGDVNMEAKIKQRLLEEPGKSLPNRTQEHYQEPIKLDHTAGVEDLIETLSDTSTVKDKPPEPDKCNTPDGKSDMSDKQTSRSPTSGAQGEDSGIESMDALSEKSPNQASQSPHTDVSDNLKSKTQGPDLLDIEAQLAKMEGFNGEDLNENHHNAQENLEKCCELTAVLHESLKDEVIVSQPEAPEKNEEEPAEEISLVVSHKEGQEDLEPLPVRVNPPLYTYSNPEKGRGSESPVLSDSDSNSCTTKKSLLEQLLIEIPENNQAPSSTSPATRSLRTRATSKLNSPELNSPVASTKPVRLHVATKRKRHESEGSNNSLDDTRNKKVKKNPENNVEQLTKGAVKKKILDESSDSDEPLIEVAGKVRKTNNQITTTRTKLKSSINIKTSSINMNTRRSVRAIPALNTRSKGDKSNPENDILRRKTRSAVSEGEGRRKRDVK